MFKQLFLPLNASAISTQGKVKRFWLILALLFTIALLFTYVAYVPNKAFAVGQWSVTGNMNSMHGQGERTVALPNGQILIAGGSIGSGIDTNVAELYDPSTGQWAQTGNLQLALDSFSPPILLNNGQVLIGSGSLGNPGVTSTSELYDPSTGQWSYTGNTNVVHTHADTVKLLDGRVLIISGITSNNGNDETSTSELYDPSTGQWTLTGSVNNPIFDGGNGDVVLLNDGRVLKVGNRSGSQSTLAEIYDPSTGTWTRTGDLLQARTETTLIKLQDGKVLMISGAPWGPATSECEIYDPATGQWTQTGSVHYGRIDLGAVLLPDGRVFIAGGDDGTGSSPLPSEIYDPAIGTWSVDASVNSMHNFATLTMLSNGKIFLADGQHANAELYAPATNHAPVIGTVTVTPNPIQKGTAVTASASFTDADTTDTHTATWDWGDGNTTVGTVTESNGSGSVSNTHTYTTAGLYSVTLTVTDNNGASATSTYQYIAVYDPTKSINGTGHMQSPAGALTSNPSQTGVLQFQMNGQYNTGHTIPSGNVQFNFNAGNFNFHLTTFKWIVVAGNTICLEGIGRVNGAGSYTVFESATTTSPYKLRIQVTDSTNNVLYDNQPGAALTAQPTETISDGSIIVQ